MNNKESNNTDQNSIKFQELFNTFYEPLVGFASSYMRDEKEAEDIVQDMFTKLWNIRDEIDYSLNVKSLIFTSTKNKCLNRLRSLKQENKINEVDALKFNRMEMSLNHSTIEDIDLNELIDRINSILDKLPPDYRTIFEKNRTKNMSYVTIAQEMNVSVKTVEKKMSRVLKDMRKDLNDYGYMLFFLSI